MNMNNKGMFTSNTPEWSTPPQLFDELDKEFHFTLDVCATKENAKCKRYFTKEDDGLKQSWSATYQDWKRPMCWMNPPYGREIGKWVEKASHNQVVCLLPARTDTRWFHDYIYNKPKVEIRFIKGRLKFGGSKNSAPFPSMIVIFK